MRCTRMCALDYNSRKPSREHACGQQRHLVRLSVYSTCILTAILVIALHPYVRAASICFTQVPSTYVCRYVLLPQRFLQCTYVHVRLHRAAHSAAPSKRSLSGILTTYRALSHARGGGGGLPHSGSAPPPPPSLLRSSSGVGVHTLSPYPSTDQLTLPCDRGGKRGGVRGGVGGRGG